MSNIKDILIASPVLSFLIVLLIVLLIESVIKIVSTSIQIWLHGYPCTCEREKRKKEICADCPRRKEFEDINS